MYQGRASGSVIYPMMSQRVRPSRGPSSGRYLATSHPDNRPTGTLEGEGVLKVGVVRVCCEGAVRRALVRMV